MGTRLGMWWVVPGVQVLGHVVVVVVGVFGGKLGVLGMEIDGHVIDWNQEGTDARTLTFLGWEVVEEKVGWSEMHQVVRMFCASSKVE